MIEWEEALQIVLTHTPLLGRERVGLERAGGRVLAEDIEAKENIPPFSRASMDGYALRSRDTQGASRKMPVGLRIKGDIRAGEISQIKIEDKETMRIMTGAPLPLGADAVLKVEDGEEKEGWVYVFGEIPQGSNIAKEGEDVKKGERVLKEGDLLTPPRVGMLASLGYGRVWVRRKPRVGIISTGDELIPPQRKLTPGRIRDANSYGLVAEVNLSGGEAHFLGIVRDRKEKLKEKLKKGKRLDLLLLSGGVSVGKYDLVREVLEEVGVKSLFWKVRIKPGKPVFFGKWGRRLVFGLPGYPVSSLVTFEILVKPCLRRFLGREPPLPTPVKATLEREIENKGERKALFRGKLLLKEDGYHILPFKVQKSGVLKSMIFSDALIVCESQKRYRRGEKVEIFLLGEKQW